MLRFLLRVQENYRNNPFHNFRHAFCVTQMMYVLIHGCRCVTMIMMMMVMVMMVMIMIALPLPGSRTPCPSATSACC